MKTLKILSLTSSILMVSYFGQPAFAQLDLENEDNRIAYSIGANIGQNLLAQQVVEGLDIDAFLAGMEDAIAGDTQFCLLYTSPSPRDRTRSRMPSSA